MAPPRIHKVFSGFAPDLQINLKGPCNISDGELVEKVLQMFSDIPTTTQAIAKLKALRQGENESNLAYNQRYRILVERVEGQTIEQITSPVAMEMYLGTIIPPL